jgi:hypothetical protein
LKGSYNKPPGHVFCAVRIHVGRRRPAVGHPVEYARRIRHSAACDVAQCLHPDVPVRDERRSQRALRKDQDRSEGEHFVPDRRFGFADTEPEGGGESKVEKRILNDRMSVAEIRDYSELEVPGDPAGQHGPQPSKRKRVHGRRHVIEREPPVDLGNHPNRQPVGAVARLDEEAVLEAGRRRRVRRHLRQSSFGLENDRYDQRGGNHSPQLSAVSRPSQRKFIRIVIPTVRGSPGKPTYSPELPGAAESSSK